MATRDPRRAPKNLPVETGFSDIFLAMFRFDVVAHPNRPRRSLGLCPVRLLLARAPDGATQSLDVYRPGLTRELEGAAHYFVGVPAAGPILRNVAGYEHVFAHPTGGHWIRRENGRWVIGTNGVECHDQFTEADASALEVALCAAYRRDHPDIDFGVVGAATTGWLRGDLAARGFAVIKLKVTLNDCGGWVQMLFVRQVPSESVRGYRRLIWARWVQSSNRFELGSKVDGARRGYQTLDAKELRDAVEVHNAGGAGVFSPEGAHGLKRLLLVESLSAA